MKNKKRNPIDYLTILLVLVFSIFLILALLNWLIYADTPFHVEMPKTSNIIDQSDTSNALEQSSEKIDLIAEASNKTNTEIPKNTADDTIQNTSKQPISVSISIIGDIMCHNTQFKDALQSDGTYNFMPTFEPIKSYLESADISIGNLETTFAGEKKKYSGYPMFNTPDALAYNLKECGIDILTTANNHSLDTSYSGIERTLEILDNAEISHTGTSRSPEEQNEILIKDVNGLKIAFLAYTYGTNGNVIPKGKEYCINLIREELILSQIQKAKDSNVDLICTSVHWGNEYETVQNNDQKQVADFLFQNGVDIIFGSHPHVLQPMETKTITLPDGTEKNVFVIYSLGNFMSGQTQENTRRSIILNLNITKESNGKIKFDKISYIPIYTYTYPNYKNYRILDINQAIYNFDNGLDSTIPRVNYQVLKSELEKTNNMYSEF